MDGCCFSGKLDAGWMDVVFLRKNIKGFSIQATRILCSLIRVLILVFQ